MKYELKVYSIFEQGQRSNQEDCIFPAKGQEHDSDRLFVLCDGMGGHESGEVASATVCEAISQSIFTVCQDSEGTFSDENLQTAISQAFDALDACETSESPFKKMGTTMTLLKLHNKGCTIAHIGDSRVYHIRPGKNKENTQILFVTEDHSLVNDLIKLGELTPEEARHSRQKNIITRAMQPHMEQRPRADLYHTADIQPGDFFYLCSDGMLEQEEYDNRYIRHNFSEATGDDEEKVRILTMATSQNSDNHSAIIVHITDVIREETDLIEEPIETEPNAPKQSAPEPIILTPEEEQDRNVEEMALKEKEQQPQIDKTIREWIRFCSKGKQIKVLIAAILLILILTLAFISQCSKHIKNPEDSDTIKVVNTLQQ